MGYQTRYELNVLHDSPAVEQSIRDAIVKQTDYDPFEDSCKWYEYQEVCEVVSAQFPDVLFVLDGEGEETGDKWRCFFKGGKSEKHEMPKWDPPAMPSKLK